MSNPTDRLRTAVRFLVPRHARPLVGACLASALLAFGCDAETGRDSRDRGQGRDRLDEAEDAIGDALSQAAAHVRNESNWVTEDPAAPGDDGSSDPPADGGDMPGGDGSNDGSADDGGGEPGGASCVGSCGASAPDGSCYCDAECTSNGDCCTDYAQQCGGAGDGGGDDGAGDGGAVATCAGLCGGAGSDGSCYCDGACTGNGDCCADYAQQCGGGGGDGGGAATCNGYCGGLGSDGACYCDDACEQNGDCCDDFAAWCAVGAQLEPEALDLAAAPRVQQASEACWGIITDPVDLERIGTVASVSGIAVGSSCVAVVVVPATAGAVPSGGITVGAAALACSTAALAGGATGALAELASQKMGTIAQCSGDILASVMQVFPWGVGEQKVDVPVYTSTPANPGNCTPDEKDALQADVTNLCKNAGSRSCSFADACPTIQTKIDVAAKCIEARQKINSQCFDGGDAGHITAVQQEVNLQNNCWSISNSVGC